MCSQSGEGSNSYKTNKNSGCLVKSLDCTVEGLHILTCKPIYSFLYSL